MKNWIFTHLFKKEIDTIRKEFYTQVMAAAVKDVEETRIDDTDKKANILADKKLMEMFSPVDYSKVVYADKMKGIVTINGERVDEGRLANLHAEAEALTQMDIWSLIYETPKELAHKAMFIDGDSIDTMKKGRSMLYHLSAQKNIIELFKSYRK